MVVHVKFRKLGTLIALGLAMAFLAQTARAATYSWANVGTTWSDASNWGGTAPTGIDVGQFASPSYTGTQPTLSGPASIGALWSTGGGTLNITGDTLTMNAATVNGHANTGIEVDAGAGPFSISSGIVLANPQSWLNNSSNAVTVSGNVSGTGPLTIGGSGTVILSGTNTYSLGTTVGGGYLTFASSSAVPGTATISINGNGSLVAAGAQTTVMGWLSSGEVNTGSTGAIAITGSSNEAINFAASSYNSLALSSTGAATYSGTITPGSNGYLFGGDASTNLTVSTPISTSGTPIQKVSTAGNVTLSSVALTGSTTINGTGTADYLARLNISSLSLGSNTLSIGSGGAVGIPLGSTSGAVTINNGGTLYFEGGTLTSSSSAGGTITVKTGGKLEGRDFNNTAATSVQNIVLDGGTIGNGTILNSNGGGAATLLRNNINVTSNGGILTGNNTAFGIYLRLSGALSGSGADRQRWQGRGISRRHFRLHGHADRRH